MKNINYNITGTQQSLKSRLQNGGILYGMALLSYSPTIAGIAAFGGYDFVIIDMEHGYGGIADARSCSLKHSGHRPRPREFPPGIKKVLDLGPQGIVFTQINEAEQAKKAVSQCLYPPDGVRGVATPIVRAFRFRIHQDYSNQYAKDLLIICQVETDESVRNVDKIAGVEGVDAVVIGPYDLSTRVGCMSNPIAEKVQELMCKIEKTVLGFERKEDGGPFLAGFVVGPNGSDQFRRRGYQCIRGACDVVSF